MLRDQRAIAAALHQHQVEDHLLAQRVRPPGQAPKLGATNELYQRLAPERGLGGRPPGQRREIFDLAGPHQLLGD